MTDPPRGGPGLLKKAPLPEAPRQRSPRNIDPEPDRLQRLIDKLLSLARVEKRQHLEGVERIDLRQPA